MKNIIKIIFILLVSKVNIAAAQAAGDSLAVWEYKHTQSSTSYATWKKINLDSAYQDNSFSSGMGLGPNRYGTVLSVAQARANNIGTGDPYTKCIFTKLVANGKVIKGDSLLINLISPMSQTNPGATNLDIYTLGETGWGVPYSVSFTNSSALQTLKVFIGSQTFTNSLSMKICPWGGSSSNGILSLRKVKVIGSISCSPVTLSNTTLNTNQNISGSYVMIEGVVNIGPGVTVNILSGCPNNN